MVHRDRPDGTRVTELPRLRRIMPFIMPRRADAVVYFEQRFDLTQTLDYIDRWNADPDRPRLTLFHVLLTASARMLHDRPRVNRFIAGRRVWQRKTVDLSVSVIKTKHDDSKLTVVKQTVDATDGLAATRNLIEQATVGGRGVEKTASEKEVDLVTRLPRFVIDFLVWVQKWADHHNLLPASLIRNDPLYASMLITNLGSIGIDAAWHHMYEHGTLSIFTAIGKVAPMHFETPEGGLEVRRGVILRFAFDERVADGYYAARSLDLLQRFSQEPWLLETPADRGPGAPG